MFVDIEIHGPQNTSTPQASDNSARGELTSHLTTISSADESNLSIFEQINGLNDDEASNATAPVVAMDTSEAADQTGINNDVTDANEEGSQISPSVSRVALLNSQGAPNSARPL